MEVRESGKELKWKPNASQDKDDQLIRLSNKSAYLKLLKQPWLRLCIRHTKGVLVG